MLAERNQWLLYKDLEAAAKPSPSRTPLEAKYGDFYASCMNVDEVNQKGAAPLKPALDRIAALKDKKQLATAADRARAPGRHRALFRFRVEQDEKDSSKQIAGLRQGGLGLPDRAYYIEKAERETKIRDQYVEHMTKMFVLAGDTPEQAAAEAKSVMAIETALAEGSLSRTDLREPAESLPHQDGGGPGSDRAGIRLVRLLRQDRDRLVRLRSTWDSRLLRGAEQSRSMARAWMRGRAICGGMRSTMRRRG